jgi:hypothetical protein
MQELIIETYTKYGPVLLVALLSGITWLYYRFLADKIKSKHVARMILNFGQELRAVIIEVNATYVDGLKTAGEDGEWTDVEKQEAKDRAIAKLKENWGPTGIKRLTKVLGIGGAVDSWLGTQVEATLDDMKRSALPTATIVNLPPS